MQSQRMADEISEQHQFQVQLKAIIPYLPQPVVEKQLANPDVECVHGEYWKGSVLFADLGARGDLTQVERVIEQLSRSTNASGTS